MVTAAVTTLTVLAENVTPAGDAAADSAGPAAVAAVQAGICLVSIAGNLLVCVTILHQRMLERTYNMFVLSLALADLLLSLTVMPLSVYQLLRGGWTLNSVWCRFFIMWDIIFCTSSILSMCAIAVDRYRALATPIAYSQSRSKRIALLLIAGSWLISVVTALGSTLPFNSEIEDKVALGECMITTMKSFVVPSSLICFFLPSLIMLVLYGQIMCVIRSRITRKRRTTGRLPGAFSNGAISAVTPSNAPPEATQLDELEENRNEKEVSPPRGSISDEETADLRATRQQQQLLLPTSYTIRNGHNGAISTPPSRFTSRGMVREPPPHSFVTPSRRRVNSSVIARDERAAKVLAVVIIAFTVCWIPFSTANIINSIWRPLHPYLFMFFVWLGYVNSMLNPFFYVGLSVEFRSAVLETLKPVRQRCACKRVW